MLLLLTFMMVIALGQSSDDAPAWGDTIGQLTAGTQTLQQPFRPPP